MPIEIFELVVSVNLTEQEAKEEAKNPLKKQVDRIVDQQAIVEEAVEQVLAILEHQKER
ncbi:MAG: DUF5908 family protein [Bacteroidota bacterium]